MRNLDMPIVTTTHGDVRGLTENDMAVWRGIPYAARRWVNAAGARRSR